MFDIVAIVDTETGEGYVVFLDEDGVPIWQAEFDSDTAEPDMDRLDLMARSVNDRN